MVERRLVLTVSDREGVMYASMVFEHEIDRRVAFHQDETRPGCIKKGHVPARHRGQMLAADNLSIEARAPRDVAHGNTEMGNGLDRNHVTLPRVRPRSLSTGPIYLMRVIDACQNADEMREQAMGCHPAPLVLSVVNYKASAS